MSRRSRRSAARSRWRGTATGSRFRCATERSTCGFRRTNYRKEKRPGNHRSLHRRAATPSSTWTTCSRRSTAATSTSSGRSLEENAGDHQQNDQQSDPKPQAPSDQFFLDGEERFIGHFLHFYGNFGLLHRLSSSELTGCQRRLNPAEENPGNDQACPDDEAEQAHHIDRGELADALLPELSEVGHHPDGEKRQDEKDAAEAVRFAHRRLDLGHQRRRRSQSKKQNHQKCHHVADDEFREAVPDLAGFSPVAFAHLDMGGPDVGKDEGPDADKDVDKDLDRHLYRHLGLRPSLHLDHPYRG